MNVGDIRLENIHFRYGGIDSLAILSGINLLVEKGTLTAIVGESGSGKTTILKLLVKFYSPTSGKITIDGKPLYAIDDHSWRSKCGVVMQDGFIFSDTILNNITESSGLDHIDKNMLEKAIKISNIIGIIEALPQGYNTKIGSGGLQLSGGQKQRILIARAIYKNPDFLFFDEATSSLDTDNEGIIMSNLEEFFIGKTVIVIAHRLSTVRKAKKIIVLNNGSISESGNHDELISRKGMYYNLVRNQLELGK